MKTHRAKDALIGGPFVFKITSHLYFTFDHQNVNSKCNNDVEAAPRCRAAILEDSAGGDSERKAQRFREKFREKLREYGNLVLSVSEQLGLKKRKCFQERHWISVKVRRQVTTFFQS